MRSYLPLLLLAAPLAAQSPRTPANSPALPADTALHVGRLPNGLTYLLRYNASPEKRLELRLVVRAGSVQEDNDQRGLAHFVEHMAFNGSSHFARNDLVKYLESIGVRFGADLNAQTSFDETIYILPVPTDKPDIVARAFDILQDWAIGVKFDSTDVVAERGVVLGEWRSGLGATSRVQNQQFPVLFKGSPYATRLPIGDTAIIAHANPAAIKRFYRDWYRPDLMAVVAVGDVPVDSLESLVRSRFGALRNPPKERPRIDAKVPEIRGTRVSVATDPELQAETVELLVRRPSHGYRTEADERRNLVNNLISTIASQRLQDVARRPDAPFIGAYFGPTRLIRDIDVYAVSVNAKSGQIAPAFEAVLREQRRLAEHGVLPAELERAKTALLRGREQGAVQQEKTFSSDYTAQYIGSWLGNTVPVTARDRYALAQRLLPTITITDVNGVLEEAASGSDRFIGVRAPERKDVKLPDRSALLAILARTDTLTLEPWAEKNVDGPLVAQAPTPGRIVTEVKHPDIGVTDWTLSNGVRVLIKPTDFQVDQIYIGGSSRGGTSLVSEADIQNAQFATGVVTRSGAGPFDPATLQRKLSGKVAYLIPIMSETEQGIGGLTAPKDLETFFQLMYLTVTQPRIDSAAVAALVDAQRSRLANRDRDPSAAFSDTVTLVMGGNSPRRQPFTVKTLNALDPARALAIFRERFGDFSGYTFEIVGNVNVDSLRPIVAQWLGGLPSTGKAPAFRDVAPSPPEGVIHRTVRKGKEPVANVVAFFTGPAPDVSPEIDEAADAAAQILETRLLDRLREALGATYSVSAGTSLERIPKQRYTSTISFQSAPAVNDSLWRVVEREVEALRTTGPTADELAKYVEQSRRETEVQVKTNPWWAGVLADQVDRGLPLEGVTDWNKRLTGLTPAQVQAAARRFFDPARVARFVLLPEQ